MPIGAAINAVGQFIQGQYNRKAAAENTDKTILANKNMAEYAYSKDLEMWNKSNAYNRQQWEDQNVYNSPTQQMERYKEAGLNPNLIYGTGTTSAGNTSLPSTSQTAKYQAPRQEYNYKPNQLGATLGQFQDVQMKSAQIDNIKAQTEGQITENIMLTNEVNPRLQIQLELAKQAGDKTRIQEIELAIRQWKLWTGWYQQNAMAEITKQSSTAQSAAIDASRKKAGTDKAPWIMNLLREQRDNIKNWYNRNANKSFDISNLWPNQ